MLYREIIAVCSEIHTKHINTLCGQNVELCNVKPGGTVRIVNTGLWKVNNLNAGRGKFETETWKFTQFQILGLDKSLITTTTWCSMWRILKRLKAFVLRGI